MSSVSLVRHTSEMRTSNSVYHRRRFPAEIISHCVWLYFRFALSFRDVEEILALRGVTLTYETVREWCLKFGITSGCSDPNAQWLTMRYSMKLVQHRLAAFFLAFVLIAPSTVCQAQTQHTLAALA